MKKLITCFLFICQTVEIKAQVPAPGKKQESGIVILNAIIHDGNGKLLPGSWLRADEGKISAIGTGIPDEKQLKNCKTVDAGGAHLYPGFILLNNTLGLAEVEAVRATLDFQETGSDNPNVHSLSAYNTDSDVIPTLRLNGVLMAQICPRGGRFSGFSSVVQLDAWNWEDAVLKERDGLHVNWPSRWQQQGWWAEPSSELSKNKDYQAQVSEMENFLEETKAYMVQHQVMNPRFEAMAKVLAGKSKLYLHASRAGEMLSGLEFFRKAGIKDLVLVGGSDVQEIIPYLKENQIPVVLNRLHDLPPSPDGSVFQPAKIPSALQNAGILFALDYEGSMEFMGSRNLGFVAGATCAYGLDSETALSLITRNPARILGIEKQVGTIEPGKDATFFLSKGNALEMKSQELKHAWIQGREVQLESKQTILYAKFRKMLSEGR